jgi:hypothetical protein
MIGIGGAIKAISALLIVAIIAAGGWYITGLRADLAISQSNEVKLREGIEEQQRLMEKMRVDIAAIQRANNQLNETIKRQAEDVTALTKKFSQDRQGNARDFGEFASTKPELVQNLVNRGTKNAYRCMEIASGSPLTDEERSATTRDKINRECPSIANPNYRGGALDAVVKSAERASEPVRPATVETVAPKTESAPAAPVRTAPPPPVRPPPPGAKK